jgi:hypothetical protein
MVGGIHRITLRFLSKAITSSPTQDNSGAHFLFNVSSSTRLRYSSSSFSLAICATLTVRLIS